MWVEAGKDGWHLRELGFNGYGAFVHRFPDLDYPEGERGMFDDYPLDPDDGVEIPAADLNAAWEASKKPG